jgi:CRISPR-associated protein Cas2
MDILITYDIADTDTDGDGARRLREVAAICEAFGTRAQFSVFECRLSPTRLARLVAQLEDVIDPTRDSIHLYRLPGTAASNRTTLGITKHHSLDDPWIL